MPRHARNGGGCAAAALAGLAAAEPNTCEPRSRHPFMPIYHIIGNVTSSADGGVRQVEAITDVLVAPEVEGARRGARAAARRRRRAQRGRRVVTPKVAAAVAIAAGVVVAVAVAAGRLQLAAELCKRRWHSGTAHDNTMRLRCGRGALRRRERAGASFAAATPNSIQRYSALELRGSGAGKKRAEQPLDR